MGRPDARTSRRLCLCSLPAPRYDRAMSRTKRDPSSGGPAGLPERWEVARLVKILKGVLPGLAERYSVKSMGVFGSYVRNEQESGSDVDILVEFHDPPGLLGCLELEGHLEELLGVRVDLVMKGALKPRIGRRILEEVVPV